MSFQQGLSGLNANSKSLEVIGNNIANANTYGAKTSRAEFANLYASTINGMAGSQTGMGVALSTVAQQFTQGNISSTQNSLDVAINGNGFFQLRDANGLTVYSRNGQFKADNQGYIVNNEGLNLLGLPADAKTGAILPGPTQPLRLPSTGMAPQVSSAATLELNLDSRSIAPIADVKAKQDAVNTAYQTKVNADSAKTAAIEALNLIDSSFKTALDADATGGTDYVGVKLKAAVALSKLDPADPNYGTAQAIDSAADSDLAAAGFGSLITAINDNLSLAEKADQTTTDAATAGNDLASKKLLLNAASQDVSTFDPKNPKTYNYANSQTAHDALGQEVAVNYYFQKGVTDPDTGVSTWNVFFTANGQTLTDGGTPPKARREELNFPRDGSAPSTPSTFDLTIPGVNNAPTLTVKLDLSAATQYASASDVTGKHIDGFGAGTLASINIDATGKIVAGYTNGQSHAVGQFELANFANVQGLQAVGNNVWKRTEQSGQPLVGVAGSATMGELKSKALEESNVDLTGELVNMITAQRMYQANAQSIKTEDQVLQTVIQLR